MKESVCWGVCVGECVLGSVCWKVCVGECERERGEVLANYIERVCERVCVGES